MIPRISVCIPCYDQGKYLAECVESVLAQTVKPHEIIVINDGSHDDTRYVAAQYPEIKYVEQVNKGLASARNAGIMNATGDYFYPLDADDMMLETCLEAVGKKIEETNADVVAPSFKCFGKHNDTIILTKDPKLEDFKPVNFQPQNRIGYFSAIKREALLEVGGYSPRMTFGYEDYHLWIDLLKRGKKFVTIQEPLILYRTKENSMINDAQAHNNELIAQIYKDFPSIK